MVDLVSIIYEYSRRERERHKREEGVFWVTDLVRCPLKRVYETIYPELSLRDLFNPRLIVGTLVHRGVEGLVKELLTGFKVEVEVEGSRRVLLSDGSEVEVRGRLDVLIVGNGSREAVEVKTARSDKSIPQRHHVDQARAYNWLFDLDRVYLLYITPERISQYTVEDRMNDAEVAERIESRRAPRYQWECSYCHYSVLCPSKVVT
jgi:CRISPR-associated exonuclease Cas4